MSSPSPEPLATRRAARSVPADSSSGGQPAISPYIEYPPRVRLEWLLAGTRVMLVAGGLLALTLDRPRATNFPLLQYLLAMYLGYSLAMVALVWMPLRFARGWAFVQHATDLLAFTGITLLTEGAASPFYMYFVYLMMCGTLRWQFRGALWTSVASMTAYLAVTLYTVRVLGLHFELDAFIQRIVILSIVALLLAYLGAYHQRFQQEISALAAWPRKMPDSTEQLVREVLTEASRICHCDRLLLIWEEPGEGYINLAEFKEDALLWAREPEGTYGSFVAPRYERASFQTADATSDRPRVVYRHEAAFKLSHNKPINEELRARFGMRGVQSWPLEGELIRGRLFVLGKPQMRLDDLMLGELVARLAVSRLDSLYFLRDLRHAAALDERVRVARDLHDGVLQSLAGTALQLMAARRTVERDPRAAASQLDEVQRQIENGELEMRTFIRRLRPESSIAVDAGRAGLRERLQEISRRVEKQWDVKVNVRLDGSPAEWPEPLKNEVFQLIRESILNAARHADPSVISVELGAQNGRLRIRIADDGSGFPFKGMYDLQGLNAMNKGPWSLRERVAALRGELNLNSTDAGSDLTITLPLRS